jgi:hypothetical protein
MLTGGRTPDRMWCMSSRSLVSALVVSLVFLPPLSFAQQSTGSPAAASNDETLAQQPPNYGFVLGTVYEVDKERYRAYLAALRKSQPDLDERRVKLDPKKFLDERAKVTVTGRLLATNEGFSSDASNSDGEYIIKRSPVGAYSFTLLYEGEEYPVQQRLDLNVELSYVAELCFVIDKEETVAWMVSDGVRRAEDVPPWVPRECHSALSGCLAMLLDDHGGFPKGLLLLLAGAGATALGLGIISTDQVEASPPTRPNKR